MSTLPLPFFGGTSTRAPFSFLPKPSSFSYSLIPFQSLELFRSTSKTFCVFSSLKAKAMPDLHQNKESGVAAAGIGGAGRPGLNIPPEIHFTFQACGIYYVSTSKSTPVMFLSMLRLKDEQYKKFEKDGFAAKKHSGLDQKILFHFWGGSKIVWIAPSGGRDRPDTLTEEWYPAKDVYVQALYKSVTEHCNVLKSAIHGKQGFRGINCRCLFVTAVELVKTLSCSQHPMARSFPFVNKKPIRFVDRRMPCKRNHICFLIPIDDINSRLLFMRAKSIRN